MTTLTPQNAAHTLKKYGGFEAEPVGPLDRGLVLGVVAPGGTGKTTLAATITDTPLGTPALHYNCRGNPFVIASYSDRIDTVTVTSATKLYTAVTEIMKDPDFPYKSIIIDTVTAVHTLDLRERYGPLTVVDWQKHSASTAATLQMIDNLISLAEGPKKINIILTFQEVMEMRTIRGQKDIQRAELDANKALQSQIPGAVTFLGFLHIDSDTPPFVRMLDFTPAEKVHQAKFQIDPNHDLMSKMPMQQWKPSLADILETLRGDRPFPVEKHRKTGAS